MPKMIPPLFLFLLLPLAASAECGFVNDDNGLTIVVNSKSNKCFTSEKFRDAFRASLVASVQAMNENDAVVAAQKRPIDYRSRSGQKLWNLEERMHQSRMPSGRYFGQQR